MRVLCNPTLWTEEIDVIEIPWKEILQEYRGEITHALVLIAFFWYQRYLNTLPPPRFTDPLKNLSIENCQIV